MLGKLSGPLIKFGVLLAKNVPAPLVTMPSASAIDGAIQRKLHERGTIVTSKAVVVILNEDIDDIIRIIKPLKK